MAFLVIGGENVDNPYATPWILTNDYKDTIFCNPATDTENLHKPRSEITNKLLVIGLRDTAVDILKVEAKTIIQTFNLKYQSISISVSPDCDNIAITHTDKLTYINRTTETINVINVPVGRTTDKYSSETTLGSVVVGPTGIAYLFSGLGSQWSTKIRCVDLTGHIVHVCSTCGGGFYDGFHGKLHPNGKHVIITDSYKAWDFNINGTCLSLRKKRNGGLGSSFWFSGMPDNTDHGDQVFTDRGNAHLISDDLEDDLMLWTSFNSTDGQKYKSFTMRTSYEYHVFGLINTNENIIMFE